MSRKVLVVGDVMTDIIVQPDGPIVPGSDRRASIRHKPGGSGANQAVWLGATGADVIFVARVAAEDVPRYDAHFRKLGVEPVLASDAEQPTGVLVTVLDPQGERSFLTDRGANLNLCAADLPENLLDGVGLVMISGYSLFSPGPRSAVRALLAVARERGIAVAVDPASVGFLEEVGPSQFLGWVGAADWIFANESEAALLTGEAEFEQQIRVLGERFTHVVIKRGRYGAVVGGKDGIAISRPAQLVKVVDTTGAGDAFAAGFVATLLGGADMAGALEAGIANGARAVQAIGGQPVAR